MFDDSIIFVSTSLVYNSVFCLFWMSKGCLLYVTLYGYAKDAIAMSKPT